MIHVGDCIEGMRGLKKGSFNLIIADPPYNLDKDFGVWKETEKKAEWKEWSREWLEVAYDALFLIEQIIRNLFEIEERVLHESEGRTNHG